MKILQLIYESLGSPFGFGGAGVRAYEIYKRLKDRHDITLLCMKYPGARDGDIEGLRHIFIGTESRSLIMSVIAYTIKTSNYVRRYGNEYDIIVENFLPSTPFFSRFLTRTPVILQVQGIIGKHSFKKFFPYYSIPIYLVERFYPDLHDRFIFVSDVTKEKVMSKINNKNKIRFSRVIPNGINKELLSIDSKEDDYILFMSRIDIYTKGLDLLIEAFKKIALEFPSIKLILTGYEFDKFDKLLSGLSTSLKERIKYAGFLTGEDKVSLLSKAKLFILPSRHESAPISILEAAACGKPLIVSDIPELKFVSEGGFGLSFPSNNASLLAEKIKSLLKNKDMRMSMGQKARRYVERFRWDKIAIDFEEAINHIQTCPK